MGARMPSTSYNSSENQSGGGTTGYGTGDRANSLSHRNTDGSGRNMVMKKLAQLEMEERDLTISYYLLVNRYFPGNRSGPKKRNRDRYALCLPF